jgi:uncharacterized protein
VKAPVAEQHFLDEQLHLARAIVAGDLTHVRSMAPHTDLNTPGAQGITLLVYAMMAAATFSPPHLSVLTELVRAGADVRQRIDTIGSVWEAALGAPVPHFTRAILDGGTSPNLPIGQSTPPLFRAASQESVETMRLLIERGSDVCARDSLKTPVITHALRAMQLDQVAELLTHGADPSAVNLLGDSFLNVLESIHARALDGSPAKAKLEEIRASVLYNGRLKWPPPSPAQERENLRKQGIEPIVPIGQER